MCCILSTLISINLCLQFRERVAPLLPPDQQHDDALLQWLVGESLTPVVPCYPPTGVTSLCLSTGCLIFIRFINNIQLAYVSKLALDHHI